MLTRFDPFSDVDRLLNSALPSFRMMPADAYRRGDEYVIEFDLPGLQQDSIEVTVERNVLEVSAERKPSYGEGDQVLVSERPTGAVRRQMHLGDDVDGEGIRADYRDGVLTIYVPVAEQAKPHKVQIQSGNGQKALTTEAA